MSNVYRDAIQDLVDNGWWQGGAFGPNGDRCLIAACNGAAGVLVDRIAEDLFPERVDPCGRGLRPAAQVNDHPHTTFEDVVLILEKAALQLEEHA